MRAHDGPTTTTPSTGATRALALIGLLASSRADALPLRGHVLHPVEATMTLEAEGTGAQVAAGRASDDLAAITLPAKRYLLKVEVPEPATGDARSALYVELPHCVGRGPMSVDGARYAPGPGPLVVRLSPDVARHRIEVQLAVTGYEERVACSGQVAAGPLALTVDGLRAIDFPSPENGGGHAIVYVPHGHDVARAGAMLVGLHPWGGSMWTYAAMGELMRAADASDVVLLMPSGLGNSLYTAPAEREVFRAIAAAGRELAVDPRRVSIWGASMGGAGATTLAVHTPDAFALVASFFGDSQYDLATYARSILTTPALAHAVDSLQLAGNLRHVPVQLFHGENDHVSPIAQSQQLADALARLGYPIRLQRVAGFGHSGKLAARFIASVVAAAAVAKSPARPARVTFTSVRPEDAAAYGVRFTRRKTGDASFDVEYTDLHVRVRAARNVTRLSLAVGALGAPRGCALAEDSLPGVSVSWE